MNQHKSSEREFKLSDTLTKTLQTSFLGLLIGNDYYQDIVQPERRKLEEGRYIINSKFGWILSGEKRNTEA